MAYDAIDAKDGADGDTAFNVGAAVEGVKDDTVLSALVGIDKDGFFVLFRDHDGDLVGGAEGVDKDLVGNDVEFLLLLALDVGGVGEAGPDRSDIDPT